jgi:hypothetical protein
VQVHHVLHCCMLCGFANKGYLLCPIFALPSCAAFGGWAGLYMLWACMHTHPVTLVFLVSVDSGLLVQHSALHVVPTWRVFGVG